MADEILRNDQNTVRVLGAVTDDANQYITMLRVDPTTKRLLVSATMASGTGTVTSVSVVTANGFAGTVANPTTTPAITLSTTLTAGQVPVSNGTGFQSAPLTGTGNIVLATSPTFSGATITTSTLNGVTLTTAGTATSYLNAAGTYSTPVGTVYTGTTNRITVTGTVIDIAATYVGQTSITTLGTVTAGTWNGSIIAGQYGGTGVANTGKTITIGGSFTTTGAFTTNLTVTANTAITLPTTGTLAVTLPYGARAYLNTTDQSIPASTFPYTIVIFNTESWDTSNEYSTSTGKYTATTAGKYQVNASLYYSGIATGKRVSISIMVNGNRISNFDNFSTLAGGDNQVIISDIINLVVNDEVTIGAYQTDTVARNVIAQSISTFCSIQRLI